MGEKSFELHVVEDEALRSFRTGSASSRGSHLQCKCGLAASPFDIFTDFIQSRKKG